MYLGVYFEAGGTATGYDFRLFNYTTNTILATSATYSNTMLEIKELQFSTVGILQTSNNLLEIQVRKLGNGGHVYTNHITLI